MRFRVCIALLLYAERERRRRCEPIPVPHAGEDDAHNKCADQFPPNRYPGMDVLVDGVSFDALQVGVRVLCQAPELKIVVTGCKR